jgi:hypothetical protein
MMSLTEILILAGVGTLAVFLWFTLMRGSARGG